MNKSVKFKLLGFRTNILWKKIVSIIYLVTCILYLFYIVTIIKSGYEITLYYIINLAKNFVLLLLLFSPYIVLSESKLRDSLPLFKNRNSDSTLIGIAILCVFAISIVSYLNILHFTYNTNDAVSTVNKTACVDSFHEQNTIVEQQQLENVSSYSNKSSSKRVFISNYGTRYHYRSSCAGKSAKECYLNEVANTHLPCKKCVRQN